MSDNGLSTYDLISWSYDAKGNIARYIFLPMLNIPLKTYEDKLIDVYVGYKHEIYLYLKEEVFDDKLFKHTQYQSDFITEQGHLIIFTVPPRFKKDYDHFINGRFSKFSSTLFSIIQELSNLSSNNKLLLAIRKADIFKKLIEEQLDCELSDEAEYLEPPIKRNFAIMEDFFKDELEDERQNS